MTPADLRTARKALGLTLREAAGLFGVRDPDTIRKWESGKNNAPTQYAILIAGAIAVPAFADWLDKCRALTP